MVARQACEIARPARVICQAASREGVGGEWVAIPGRSNAMRCGLPYLAAGVDVRKRHGSSMLQFNSLATPLAPLQPPLLVTASEAISPANRSIPCPANVATFASDVRR